MTDNSYLGMSEERTWTKQPPYLLWIRVKENDFIIENPNLNHSIQSLVLSENSNAAFELSVCVYTVYNTEFSVHRTLWLGVE